MLLFLKEFLNNIINAIIGFIFNKVAYDFRVRNIFKLLVNLLAEDFNRLRFIKWEKVNDLIAFINVMIKTRYNSIYKVVKLHEDLLIYLRFYYDYSILDINLKLFN